MPKLLIDRCDFRIVETVAGGDVVYVLEVPYGSDALGVERWRTFEQNSASIRAVVKFMIDLAIEVEALHVKRA